jgi:hypothetical protein
LAIETRQEVTVLRWLINKRLNSEERNLGVSLDYARHILRNSLCAFLKFIRMIPLAEYRRTTPAAAFHAARIAATRHDDCGECVQIAVNQATNAGISPALLQAVLSDRMGELPEAIADACRFASAVVTASGETDALRERIRRRYGEEALVELALTIAAARFFPTARRALGFAKTCARVSVRV